MTTIGRVRFCNDEEGWGVIDSSETPGGCWTHYSTVRVAGYGSLTAGQEVALQWEVPGQDGWPFGAVEAWPLGSQPIEPASAPAETDGAYASRLTTAQDTGEKPDYPLARGGPPILMCHPGSP